MKVRESDHEIGKVKSNRLFRPLKLMYYEAYLEKLDAVARELYLKSGDGRREIRKQLRHMLAKFSKVD